MEANLDLAQAIALGVVIEHPEEAGRIFAAVGTHDFDQAYRLIAEAIHGLRLAGTGISALAVIDEMTRRGTIGTIGGPAEVMRVAGFGFGSAEYSVAIIARTARVRRIDKAATWLHQKANEGDADPAALAKWGLEQLQAVADSIDFDGDVTTPTVGEFLNVTDAPPDWVVPGLLERGDRLILTGLEGLGKSVLARQVAVCSAAGVHPFTHAPAAPQRVLYVDCENGVGQLRRALRPLVTQASGHGSHPGERLFVETRPQGMDLTRPEDEAWLVRLVATLQPALVLIGPLYRLHARNPNEEEPARQVARVLDRCRTAANCALVLEAHAGHSQVMSGERPVRPTGTSLWLRWPEFGYGMRPTKDYDPAVRTVDFVGWRGDRTERSWPKRLRAGGPFPWGIVPDPPWSPSRAAGSDA